MVMSHNSLQEFTVLVANISGGFWPTQGFAAVFHHLRR
jgi:hypothetical protein